MPVSLNVSELTEDLLTPSDQLLLVSPAGSVVGDYDSTFSTHSSFLSPHFALQPAPRQPASGPISIPTRRDTQPPVLSSTPPKNPSPSSTKSSSDGFATPDSTPSTLILNDEVAKLKRELAFLFIIPFPLSKDFRRDRSAHQNGASTAAEKPLYQHIHGLAYRAQTGLK